MDLSFPFDVQFMLLANITVAKKILRHYPTLSVLRRHPSPNRAMFEGLISKARCRGFDIDIDNSKKLADSLDAAVIGTSRISINSSVSCQQGACLQRNISVQVNISQWTTTILGLLHQSTRTLRPRSDDTPMFAFIDCWQLPSMLRRFLPIFLQSRICTIYAQI